MYINVYNTEYLFLIILYLQIHNVCFPATELYDTVLHNIDLYLKRCLAFQFHRLSAEQLFYITHTKFSVYVHDELCKLVNDL